MSSRIALWGGYSVPDHNLLPVFEFYAYSVLPTFEHYEDKGDEEFAKAFRKLYSEDQVSYDEFHDIQNDFRIEIQEDSETIIRETYPGDISDDDQLKARHLRKTWRQSLQKKKGLTLKKFFDAYLAIRRLDDESS